MPTGTSSSDEGASGGRAGSGEGFSLGASVSHSSLNCFASEFGRWSVLLEFMGSHAVQRVGVQALESWD